MGNSNCKTSASVCGAAVVNSIEEKHQEQQQQYSIKCDQSEENKHHHHQQQEQHHQDRRSNIKTTTTTTTAIKSKRGSLTKYFSKVSSASSLSSLPSTTTTINNSDAFISDQQKEQQQQLNNTTKFDEEIRTEDDVNNKPISSSLLLDSRHSLSVSRSFINYSLPRSKSTKNSFKTILNSNNTSDRNNIPINYRKKTNSKSVQDLNKLSKTYWPIPYIESTFLPYFPLIDQQLIDQQYKIDGLLERGAFGAVYKVIDVVDSATTQKQQKVYAIKILNKSQIIKNDLLDQVKNEVDIQLVCGHHPFIVECISFWQTHRKICILTEFISGGELFTKIKDFTYQLVQLYVLEIAIALDFLHNAGIIYRDLKPENILLDHENHIKLVDFGLSKWLKIGQRTKTFCGTLQYMAPELLTGEMYGHAVDWWALGVIACRMITNKYPQIQMPPPASDKSIDAIKRLSKLNDNQIILIPPLIDEPSALTMEKESPSQTLSSPTSSSSPSSSTTIKCIIPLEVTNLNDKSSLDLLNRLLDVNPMTRLRSLLSLERIAMYKGYNFNDVRQKKISPNSLMVQNN